jgi:putative flavoprotein involved in K+ transport
MSEFHDVVVIGGGQAGLVASRALTERGVDHVVLERERVAERWRTARWDSLRFQFPNWALGLPGMPYDGQDAGGFAHHSEVVRLLERYADLAQAPIREHTRVTSLDRQGERWIVTTDDAELQARAVVLATGPFQRDRVPAESAQMPESIFQIHSVDYHRPDGLPDGAVLVVGSGASGAQITEDLLAAGRTVYLCVSRHRRVPRRFLGKDITTWLVELGLMDRTRADWVDGRMPPTVLVTGVGGGHDLDVRDLGERGAILLGSLRAVSAGELQLAADAESILAAADAMYDDTANAIIQHAASQGVEVAVEEPPPRPNPSPHRPTLSLRDAGVTSVIWATGYSYDLDWVHAPLLDGLGRPIQHRGIAEVDGLYFLGLHWMHTFKSGTFLGVGDDAGYIIDHLAAYAIGS